MDYLMIAATPLFLALVGLAIIRFRKLDWTGDVGFRWPNAIHFLVWPLAFIVYAVAVEQLGSGESAWGSWRGKYGAVDVAVRILAIGLVYPIVEEFFFRGVFFGVLRRKLGPVAAIILPAILFGLVHVQYDWPVWIIADGLFFGLARWRSGSVYIPMLLHMMGNAYAVWERLQ